MARASGIGLSLEMRWRFGHGFVFGDSLWLWVYGSASGVRLGVWESIANVGMRDSFGIVQLAGKSGEKRKYCKVSRKELEAGGGKVFVFLLLARECSHGKERLTWSSKAPHGCLRV